MADELKTGEVRVEGLAALQRTLGRMSKQVRIALRERLLVIAREVALTAHAHAVRQGFEKPGTSGRGKGRLLSTIRGSVVRNHVALIRDSARNRATGFSYPRRWEYGEGGARAYMRPAVDEDRAMVVRELEEMLGTVLVIE